MGKFLHEDAGSGCGDGAERLGIVWPGLPWKCPLCGLVYRSHETTVATLDVTRYEHPEETTFLCVPCDLLAFAAKQESS